MALPGNWAIGDILTLTCIRGLNNPMIRQLVGNYNSLDELLESDKPVILDNKLPGRELFPKDISPCREEAQDQLSRINNTDLHIISYWDDSYPQLLKETTHPPIALFIWGRLPDNRSNIISIVGTRHSTSYGRLTAEKFASAFTAAGIIVCSGLANGIDTIAHLSTIESGGTTYAIIASGLDCIAPPHILKNAGKIVETGGSIISEYKFGTKALPAYFPQRNRIISGISKATLVVESGKTGGALITARFAFDQSREVFAVPGNISSEKSIGTNELIKKGLATPALSPASMLEDLGLISDSASLFSQPKAIKFNSIEEERIYYELSNEPKHIDEILQTMNIEISELLVKLLELEFKGVIRQLPGKYYIRM